MCRRLWIFQGDTAQIPTVTDREALRKELALTRQRGYSLDNEEFGSGIICLAAPIFDYSGAVVGTVGCSFSTVNCSIQTIYEHCGEEIIKTAKQISVCMGYCAD